MQRVRTIARPFRVGINPERREAAVKDLFSIEGKVALVTGGSRGIGEMISAGFLANGAKVYISSRNSVVCDATA